MRMRRNDGGDDDVFDDFDDDVNDDFGSENVLLE